jgi:hypothetical protein
MFNGSMPPGAVYVAPPGTPIIVKNSTLEREIIYRGSGVSSKKMFSTPVMIGGGTLVGIMFIAVMATFFMHVRRARNPVAPDEPQGHASVTIDLGQDRTLTIQNDDMKARDIVNYLKGLRFRRMDTTMSTMSGDGPTTKSSSGLDITGSGPLSGGINMGSPVQPQDKYAAAGAQAERSSQLSEIGEETLSTTESNRPANDESQGTPKRSKFREWLNGSRPAKKINVIRDKSPGGGSSVEGQSDHNGTQSEYTNMTNSQDMHQYSVSRGRSPGADGEESFVSELSSQGSSRGRSRSPGEKVVDRRS